MTRRIALLSAISACALFAGCATAPDEAANEGAAPESVSEVTQQLPYNAYVTIYEHCNYQGAAHTFYPPLDYNSFSKGPYGDFNDRYSSIRVYNGAMVSLFEHDNYQGREVPFSADNACFVGIAFNDMASSLAWWTW